MCVCVCLDFRIYRCLPKENIFTGVLHCLSKPWFVRDFLKCHMLAAKTQISLWFFQVNINKPTRYPESSPYLHHLFIRNAATVNYFLYRYAYNLHYVVSCWWHTLTHVHVHEHACARIHTHTHTQVQLLFTILCNFVDLKISYDEHVSLKFIWVLPHTAWK